MARPFQCNEDFNINNDSNNDWFRFKNQKVMDMLPKIVVEHGCITSDNLTVSMGDISKIMPVEY